MSDFESAKTSATKGLEILDVTKITADIKQPMANSKRDLLNVKIRSSNKISNSADPWKLRVEEAAANNMDLTLMPEDEQDDAKSSKSKNNLSEIEQQMQALGGEIEGGESDEEDE